MNYYAHMHTQNNKSYHSNQHSSFICIVSIIQNIMSSILISYLYVFRGLVCNAHFRYACFCFSVDWEEGVLPLGLLMRKPSTPPIDASHSTEAPEGENAARRQYLHDSS